MSNSALPPHLQGKKHWDYPWPLSLIPRAYTSYKWVQPPVLLWGNQYNFEPYLEEAIVDPNSWDDCYDFGPGPIPNPLVPTHPGKWGGFKWGLYGVKFHRLAPYLPLGFACSMKIGTRRVHFRIGARWDNIDSYYTFPSFEVTFKKKYKK